MGNWLGLGSVYDRKFWISGHNEMRSVEVSLTQQLILVSKLF